MTKKDSIKYDQGAVRLTGGERGVSDRADFQVRVGFLGPMIR